MRDTAIAMLYAGIAAGTVLTGIGLSAIHQNPVTIYIPDSDVATITVGLGGALLGALVGGIASWWLQRRSFLDSQKAHARRVALKLNLILKDLLNFKIEIDRRLEAGKAKIEAGDAKWTVVPRQIGSAHSISIDLDEIAVFIAAGVPHLGDRAIEAGMWHKSIVSAMETYGDWRHEISKHMKIIGAEGDNFKLEIDTEGKPEMVIRIREIETLFESIIARLDEFIPKIRDLTREAPGAFHRHFGNPF